MNEGRSDAAQEGVDYQLEEDKNHQDTNRQVAGSKPCASNPEIPNWRGNGKDYRCEDSY